MHGFLHVSSYADRFVRVKNVRASPAISVSSRELPWNVETLFASGSSITPSVQVYLPALDRVCPTIFANSSFLSCNLTAVGVGALRGPLEAILRQDGGSSDAAFVAILVSEPRVSRRAASTKIAANAETIRIDAQYLGTEVDDLSITISTTTLLQKRREAHAEITCSIVDLSSSDVTCRPAALLPGGEFVNATISRSSGRSQSFFLGEVVSAPVLTATSFKLASNAPELTISGTGFYPEGSQVRLEGNGTLLSCSVILERSSPTGLICRPAASIAIGSAAAFVSSFGGAASPSSVALQVVPPPAIVSSTNSIFDTATQFTFLASNYNVDNLTANSIFLTLNATASGVENLIPCSSIAVPSEGTLSCTISTPFRQLSSVFAVLKAHGGSSNVTQVGVLVKDTSFLAVVGLGGLSGIVLGGVALVVVLVIVIIILARKIQVAAARKRNARLMNSIPDDQKHLFNIKASDITIIKKLGEGSFGSVSVQFCRLPSPLRCLTCDRVGILENSREDLWLSRSWQQMCCRVR